MDMQAEIIRKKHQGRKKTGRPHLKILKNFFCLLEKKIKLPFFLAFLDQIHPLTNPLHVINFSKKLLSTTVKKIVPVWLKSEFFPLSNDIIFRSKN